MNKLLFPGFLVVSSLLLAAIAPPCSAAEPKQNSGDNSAKATTTPTKGYKDVNVEQFDKLRSNTNAVILDVRTPEEFEAGHIPGAKNIDINSLDFDKKTGQLDKSKTY